MTAQVEFFCSPEEERAVLRYLTKDAGTLVFDLRNGNLNPWDSFSADELPKWPDPLIVCLVDPDHGELAWHSSAPPAVGQTHRSLVMNLFAREEWNKRGLGDGDRLLDIDLSPVLIYRRGVFDNGRTSQNLLWAPPSSLKKVGAEYERRVARSLRWIRRRGAIIHDYRQQSPTIPDPNFLLNTIYAFPDVIESIRSKTHSFVIA